MRFEDLERVEPQLRLRDLECFAEDGAGFVLGEKEGPMGFAFGDLLEEAKEIDIRKEEAGGEVRERLRWERACCGEAQFVDFGSLQVRIANGR